MGQYFFQPPKPTFTAKYTVVAVDFGLELPTDSFRPIAEFVIDNGIKFSDSDLAVIKMAPNRSNPLNFYKYQTIVSHIAQERIITHLKKGDIKMPFVNLSLAPVAGQTTAINKAKLDALYEQYFPYASSIVFDADSDLGLNHEIKTQFVTEYGLCSETKALNSETKVEEFVICDRFLYYGLMINVVVSYNVHGSDDLVVKIVAIDPSHGKCSLQTICTAIDPIKFPDDAKRIISDEITQRIKQVIQHRLSTDTLECSAEFSRILTREMANPNLDLYISGMW